MQDPREKRPVRRANDRRVIAAVLAELSPGAPPEPNQGSPHMVLLPPLFESPPHIHLEPAHRVPHDERALATTAD